METEPTKAKKKLWVFAAASFLNDMGSDIIYPIWPLFVTQVLKANMAALGFLDGLGDALVSLSQAASGYASDRIRKRKIFIWTGYLCGSLSRLGYAISAVWQHLVPFRILDRAGKVRSAPRDAMVADMTTASERGRSFGLLRAMDNLGAVCGIFSLGPFRYSFLLVHAKMHGFKVTFVPVLYLIFTTAASLFSLPFGGLADRIGRKTVLYLAFFFWAAVCAGMITSPSRPLIILIFVLYGLHKAALEPVQRTLVLELSPLPFRASCLGAFQMITGLCALPASFVAGLLWDKVGMEAPFVFSLALTVLAAGLLLLLKEKPSP
jgi:MFS family permease